MQASLSLLEVAGIPFTARMVPVLSQSNGYLTCFLAHLFSQSYSKLWLKVKPTKVR